MKCLPCSFFPPPCLSSLSFRFEVLLFRRARHPLNGMQQLLLFILHSCLYSSTSPPLPFILSQHLNQPESQAWRESRRFSRRAGHSKEREEDKRRPNKVWVRKRLYISSTNLNACPDADLKEMLKIFWFRKQTKSLNLCLQKCYQSQFKGCVWGRPYWWFSDSTCQLISFPLSSWWG